MRDLAGIYLDANRLVESIAWCEKALKATDHPSPYMLKTYARALQRAGRLKEADSPLRKALALEREQTDRRARDMGLAMVDKLLGLNLLLQGRYTEAEPVAREALMILEKETPDDWSRFHAMSMVGGALMGQQRYADAEPFLVQGYEGMKQREAFINAGFGEWLTKAGERLIRFYEATNQPGKARTLREELRSSSGTK